MNATEAIAKAVSGTTDATEIVERLAALGFVCVPREPSAEMIEAAWAWELAEDSAGVWREMINAASIVPKAQPDDPKVTVKLGALPKRGEDPERLE